MSCPLLSHTWPPPFHTLTPTLSYSINVSLISRLLKPLPMPSTLTCATTMSLPSCPLASLPHPPAPILTYPMTVSLISWLLKPVPMPSRMAALPKLEVRMMMQFLKLTVRPWESVTRPSSRI